MPTFGRLYAPDERDAAFPMRALVAPPAQLLPYKRWAPGAVLDQGPYGVCVGAGWEGWLRASPVRTHQLDMTTIYCEAIAVDEWADNDGDCGPRQFGTSVRAGAQVLQTHGLISAYHWATTIDDIADFICSPDGGPVVTGLAWYSGMMATDARGFIHPIGQVEGGHCTIWYHANRVRRYLTGQNSWGTWGLHGHMRISFDDMAALLAQDGEAAAAVQSPAVA